MSSEETWQFGSFAPRYDASVVGISWLRLGMASTL
jgi:hypothetical protein